jgi:hypothetical protein
MFKNDKPHAKGSGCSGPAPEMRRSLPDYGKPLQERFHEKRTLPDARRQVTGQADYSRALHERNETAIRRVTRDTENTESFNLTKGEIS